MYGYDGAATGKILGTGKTAWATLDALLAAVIVDRVARRAGSRGKVLLAAAIALGAIPPCLAGFAGSGLVAAVLVAEVTFASTLFGATMLSVVPEVAPHGGRGFAVALYAFSMTMIGGCVALAASSALAVVTARALPAPGP